MCHLYILLFVSFCLSYFGTFSILMIVCTSRSLRLNKINNTSEKSNINICKKAETPKKNAVKTPKPTSQTKLKLLRQFILQSSLSLHSAISPDNVKTALRKGSISLSDKDLTTGLEHKCSTELCLFCTNNPQKHAFIISPDEKMSTISLENTLYFQSKSNVDNKSAKDLNYNDLLEDEVFIAITEDSDIQSIDSLSWLDSNRLTKAADERDEIMRKYTKDKYQRKLKSQMLEYASSSSSNTLTSSTTFSGNISFTDRTKKVLCSCGRNNNCSICSQVRTVSDNNNNQEPEKAQKTNVKVNVDY